jgi:DNA repair protein RadC
MKHKLSCIKYTIKEASEKKFDHPEKLFEALKGDFNPIAEELYVLIMNNGFNVIDKVLIAKGTHNAMIVTPKDILTPVLLASGCNIILAHNHPSGDTQPSEDDIVFTRKVMKACEVMGIALADHIIYTSKDYLSFKKEGLM